MRLLGGLCAVAAAAMAWSAEPSLPAPQPDPAITTTNPPVQVNAPIVNETPPESHVEEVTVEAPEPRYVAPTRRDRIGRVWAPVTINGRGPFRLVLDTGANGSAVVASVAQRLETPTSDSHIVHLRGVTGSAFVPAIDVDSMEVGELLLEHKRLPVVANVFGGAEGVLGTDGLLDKRILIDFGRDEISIMRSHAQRAAAGFAAIPVRLRRDRLLTMNVMLGTIAVKAVLDTGAQQTIGNSALRDLLRRRSDTAPREQDVIGVTLDVSRGEVVAVPTLHLGAIAVSGLQLTFGDMFIFEHWNMTREPTLLIGMDIIGSFDVLIIDYKKRELHIRAKK